MSDEKIGELAIISGKELVLKTIRSNPDKNSDIKEVLKGYSLQVKVEIFKQLITTTKDKVEGSSVIQLAIDALSVDKHNMFSGYHDDPEALPAHLAVIEAYAGNKEVVIPETALNLLNYVITRYEQDLSTDGHNVTVPGILSKTFREGNQKLESIHLRSQEIFTRSLRALADVYSSLAPLEEPIRPTDINESESLDSIRELSLLSTTEEQRDLVQRIASDAWRYLGADVVGQELSSLSFNELTEDGRDYSKYDLLNNIWNLRYIRLPRNPKVRS